MKVMVVGGGGREHAIIKSIKKNKKISRIFALPGNGGIAADAECVPIAANDIDGIVKFARAEKIDFAIIAPDDPLVMGSVDRLNEAGVRTFGPVANAAIIEGSKTFAKSLMKKYGIPTAEYQAFCDYDSACEHVKNPATKYPIVIKADGLAFGKGVTIAADADEAIAALKSAMCDRVFGSSGERVVIEEFLTGPEVSVLALTDGKTMRPLVSAMDHKRALDGDKGPNTGGMGVIAPNPYYTDEISKQCMEKIFLPTMRAMNEEGRTFKGCLYFGLILTTEGPKVIEYNCRFGDPEAQAVLPLIKSDIFEHFLAVNESRLAEEKIEFSDGACCCVVLASSGYPAKYTTGHEIFVGALPENSVVYHAGTKRNGNAVLSSGGRVIGVSAVAENLEKAVELAYKASEKVSFENKFFRTDIGKKALIKTSKSVPRIYVERQPEYAEKSLESDIKNVLGISASVRVINRYDIEGDEKLINNCLWTVFAEPQTDLVLSELPNDCHAFAVEYLPGQYDQRADAAAQCIALISESEPPTVRTGRVYLLSGDIANEQIESIKRYVINPVESREVSLAPYKTLEMKAEVPGDVPILDGALSEYSLAMDADDIRCCEEYFKSEGRKPTLTELRVLDTYWSDHCRHTTFSTEIDKITINSANENAAYKKYLRVKDELGDKKPVTLMNLATAGMRYLRKKGMLNRLDESEEINACTVKIDVDVNSEIEPWLLLFKNETHNHPTEIEPFGGAATCIGGAIRDPLSGRGYVYHAMRVTGAADPRKPLSETILGKLPQRKIVATAAAGYSSYGNQIGVATGLVDEIYHEGYAAKRMEIGAVIAAVPEKNVRRETPVAGDVVILLGGKTGRDGCGGATGSSKAHNEDSLSSCGAEVQKGNAPEERKIQRFFRNYDVTRLIKRCNDFGAGGVSVAIGELADGLEIDLDKIPKKYEGLDGTELAISESQERMAVMVSDSDAQKFIELADAENLSATIVAVVTETPRLVMKWRGKKIVDISRKFIDTHGERKHVEAVINELPPSAMKQKLRFAPPPPSVREAFLALASDLNVCCKRGLVEKFDSTIGAGSVLMPMGGKYQATPTQVMAAKIPLEHGETNTCSVMSWGFDPFLSSESPFIGAYNAVVSSVAKLVAAGASTDECYLSFQEYFEKLGKDPERWGKPLSALLGAFSAQMDLGIAAIGGKDSMSGSFGELSVPPTLVSFAVTTADARKIISPEFKSAGARVVLLASESLKQLFSQVHEMIGGGKVVSAYSVAFGGVAEAVLKMCLGNGFGFAFDEKFDIEEMFRKNYGAFVFELAPAAPLFGKLIGHVTAEQKISHNGETLDMEALVAAYQAPLEEIFPSKLAKGELPSPFGLPPLRGGLSVLQKPPSQREVSAKPTEGARQGGVRVLIPVFPGTNCEIDSARAVERAGALPNIFVLNTRSPSAISESIKRFAECVAQSEIIFLPGGFSNGDEPDGSAKFIAAFLRNPLISAEISKLLDERRGLMLGVCNGFQALIKLGLVPFGKITEPSATSPTITYNAIGRHQSRLVRTRVCSDLSPWFSGTSVGEIFTVPISHGEGRFVCEQKFFDELTVRGQIAAQYVDLDGEPTMDIDFNPAGSFMAVEAITSPDGRVLGKMGHSERVGNNLYKNVAGTTEMNLFTSAVRYFSK